MKRIIISVIFTVAALSAFGQTATAAHFECTSEVAAAAGTSCAVVTLQIETAGATELRTWPGTNLNFQAAYAEWSAVDERLRADIASRNMSAYRRHIWTLALRGPVKLANAVRLTRLSFDVPYMLPAFAQNVREVPTTKKSGIPVCNARAYQRAVAAGSSTDGYLAATLLQAPAQWREQVQAFAAAVDKANTGLGRVVADERYGWISASDAGKTGNGT